MIAVTIFNAATAVFFAAGICLATFGTVFWFAAKFGNSEVTDRIKMEEGCKIMFGLAVLAFITAFVLGAFTLFVAWMI